MAVETIKSNVGMSWKTISLGNLIEVLSGFAFDSKKFSDSNGMPLIRIRDIKRSYTETFYNGSFDEKYVVKSGDVLIGMDGEFNVAEWNGNDALLNQRVCKVSVKDSNKLDLRYLLYFLPFELKLIEDKASFVTVKHLSVNDIKNIQIPLPPLSTQKRIAEILDAADALRRKDQELLKKYDELAQAIFIDMFGDPVKNEKGWEIKSLSEIMDVDAKAVDPNEMDEYNYIGLEHIEKETGKILVIDKGKVVSNKFLFTEDHILYGKLRPYLNKVAVPDFSGICSTDIFPLKPKNKLMKQFLVSVLRSKEFVNHSNTNAVGANLPRANKDVILNFRTTVPRLDTVIKYSSNIGFINKQKELIELEIIKSEILFNSLIQKAFKGELV